MSLTKPETIQELTDEIKRLRRVNRQQAEGWKSAVDQLRDANVYIGVLEHECEMWKGRYYDLANDNAIDLEGGE